MTVEEERRGHGRARIPIVRHPNSDKHAAACHSALLIGRSHLMIDQIQAQAPLCPFSSFPAPHQLPAPKGSASPSRHGASNGNLQSSYQYAAGLEHACRKHDSSQVRRRTRRISLNPTCSLKRNSISEHHGRMGYQLLRARTLALQDSAHRRRSYYRKSFEFERLRWGKLPQNWSAVVALLYFF
jgi:hypothetical protein